MNGLVLLAYTFASIFTSAYFMGDTADYAQSIVAFSQGRNYQFWEFGHVLWRPLGFLVFSLFSRVTQLFVGTDPYVNATVILLTLSWFAGLITVLSLHGLLTRVCAKRTVVTTTTIAFIFLLAFLNYFHTGSSYVPGLSLVVLAMYILVAHRDKEKRIPWAAILSGSGLAGAVCFWFPYVLVVPAAAISHLFFLGFNRRRVVLVVHTAIVFAVLTGLTYTIVMLHIGIHSASDFKAWMALTSRPGGVTSNSGLAKVVFGFARSFISMGNDGMIFKRYLLHDPFNPVSALGLLKLSIWKLLAFYLFILFILLNLLTSAIGRRVIVLLALAALPVIAFAVRWQGGDPERYLPLYPFLIVSLALSLESVRARAIPKYAVLLFLGAAVITNITATATPSLDKQHEVSATRIRVLLPLLGEESRVVTANWQDDLINFNRSFPLDPINRNNNLHLVSVITPGEAQTVRWREDFSLGAQSTWGKGGDIWLSKRLFASRPLSDWNWVEGDDPRVSWTDLHEFFSRLEVGQSVGGDDGFVLILPSSHNKEILATFARAKQPGVVSWLSLPETSARLWRW